MWVAKFLFHSLFLDLKTNKQSPPLIYRLPWEQLWFCISGQGRGREPHTAGKCGVRRDAGRDPPPFPRGAETPPHPSGRPGWEGGGEG